MAKTKAELLDEAQRAGKLGDDVDVDDYSLAQLEQIIGQDVPAAGWVPSHRHPQTAPDGHVNLSQEDIDNRA